MSGSLKSHPLSGSKRLAQASRPKPNTFGYMVQGEEGILGVSFQGKRKDQEDGFDFETFPPRALPETSEERRGLLQKAIQDLGNELTKEYPPLDKEEDDEPFTEAGFSACTHLSVLVDFNEATWGSVGDSTLLTCVIKEDKSVHLNRVNPLHKINRASFNEIKARNPAIYQEIKKYQKPKDLTTERGRIAALAMARCLGAVDAVKCGISSEPETGSIDYQNIPNYKPNEDQLFLILASDGLIDSFEFTSEEKKEIEKDFPVKTLENIDTGEEAYLSRLDKIDAYEAKKEAHIYKVFKNSIAGAIKNNDAQPGFIADAILGTLNDRLEQGLQQAVDNTSLLIIPAGPEVKVSVVAHMEDGNGGRECVEYMQERFMEKITPPTDSLNSSPVNRK